MRIMQGVFFIICASAFSAHAATESNKTGVDAVIAKLLALEQQREPKCYATASRLEDFMFGTPLSSEARFAKNLLQKSWVEWIWQQASAAAKSKHKSLVDETDIADALGQILTVKQDAQSHFALTLNNKKLRINGTDKRQYSSVAYSLRAILAVQQDLIISGDENTLLLSELAVAKLADALDLVSLAVLKVADESMRLQNKREVDRSAMVEVWLAVTAQPGQLEGNSKTAATNAEPKQPVKPADLTLLRAMIAQKLASYEAYNNVSQQLFIRNLQVYFARNRWPANASEGTAFSKAFTESMISLSQDIYLGAQNMALANGHNRIQEQDVALFTQQYIPHRINEYEDAIFFPRLPRKDQVVIESYDMDAFRDPGWHWRYLGSAIDSEGFKAQLQLDPFAAELLTENVAQYGVLILRVTGDIGRELGEDRIALKHLEQAFATIQQRVNRNSQISESTLLEPQIASAKQAAAQSAQWFSDVTEVSAIKFMHRNSDWLNRLMRSYLKKGDGVGEITIPPAFGGAGVAAEDINNDGLVDVLLLSGLGNKLFLNAGDDKFQDITAAAGLDWRRTDSNLPGEPRQALIADLNNDGWQDIVITYVDDLHRVYQNIDGRKFKDVTEIAKLGGVELVGGPATVFDFDGDGLLDIYIQYFGDYLKGVLPTLARRNFNGLPNKLFRNTGNFKFEDVSKNSGVEDSGWGQSVTHTDLNGDGLQDLISGNDFGVNRYYINQGKGKFKEVSEQLGTDKPSYTMSIGITDLNRDRVPDIYISNIVTMNKDETYVMPNQDTKLKFNPEKMKNMRVVEANDLFVSTGSGAKLAYMQSDKVGRGRSSTGWSWDADFFDFDNDGDDDLYVLNGMNEYNVYSSDNPYYLDPLENKKVNVHIPVSLQEANVFFENVAGRLEERSKISGMDFLGNSRSAAYFDLDNDGDLDVVTNDFQGPAKIFRNDSQTMGNHWVSLRLIGNEKQRVNRDAIGARIIATTPEDGQVFREVRGSEGYMSVHPKRQYFGLGKASKVEFSIRWPDGTMQSISDLAVNQHHAVHYPEPN